MDASQWLQLSAASQVSVSRAAEALEKMPSNGCWEEELLSCLGCFLFKAIFHFWWEISSWHVSRTQYNSKLSLSSLQVHCLWRKFISSPPRRSLAKWCNFMIFHAISIGGWAAGVILSHSSLRITSLTTSCASEMAEVLASKLATCVTLCPPCLKKMNKL